MLSPSSSSSSLGGQPAEGTSRVAIKCHAMGRRYYEQLYTQFPKDYWHPRAKPHYNHNEEITWPVYITKHGHLGMLTFKPWVTMRNCNYYDNPSLPNPNLSWTTNFPRPGELAWYKVYLSSKVMSPFPEWEHDHSVIALFPCSWMGPENEDNSVAQWALFSLNPRPSQPPAFNCV